MKKKHPKLYLNIVLDNNNHLISYMSNKFDNTGERFIEKENLSVTIHNINKVDYLISKNKKELTKLNNYLKTQKKVLDKYKKAGNYDTVNVIQNSIKTMNEFKKEFKNWFNGQENEF